MSLRKNISLFISLFVIKKNVLKRLTQTYLSLMTTSGCSRSTEPLLTTTAAVSSTDQTHTATGAVASDTTISDTLTQLENTRFSKVVNRLYSNGVRNTATCTAWLTTVWLILRALLME